jgi:hypothetical protein
MIIDVASSPMSIKSDLDRRGEGVQKINGYEKIEGVIVGGGAGRRI